MRGGGISLSPLLRNALFALFIAGIFAYGAAFAVYMLSRFDLINLLRDISFDDPFYYFQIAYNLAEGNFSTFDGGITRTNGYHPLWMLMITPFYWFFDKESALFGIKVLELALVAGGVALVAAAVRLARLSWILLFALPPLLYYHPQNNMIIKGMEAAAALFMLGLFILALCLFARNSGRWKWLLVGVAFALPWVRLEYIAISLAGTGVLCLLEWSWRGKHLGAWWRTAASRREFVRSVTALKALPSLIAAAASILVYFAYNGIVFGGIIPVSAATKRAWSLIRWERAGGSNLLEGFWGTIRRPVFDYEILVALEVCVYLLLVWWFARRSRSRRDWLMLVFLAGVFSLAAGHLAKFAQTVMLDSPNDPYYPWYFVPAYLMMALITPIRCYVVIYFVRYFGGHISRLESIILSTCIVVVGALFLLWNTDFARPFRFVDHLSKSTNYNNWEIAQYAGVQIMNDVLPDGSVIGSWDSGVVGYFSRFPVVNLDGLVNSYEYFRIREMDTHAREDAYARIYRKFGITHFANITKDDRYDEYMLYESPLFLPPGMPFTIWLWEPLEKSDALAQFWDSMEPDFDYNTDGTAMVVDGRLVQLFTDTCAPNELAVLTMSEQSDDITTEAWTQTQTGLCVATTLLPQGTQPPTLVEKMSAEDYLGRLVGDSEPVISSGYEVYLVDGDLIYAKQECTAADTDAEFFLHIYPLDAADLPIHRKQHGFDNLDFVFSSFARYGDMCVMDRALPDYAIDEIKTGQYRAVDGEYERLWEGTIAPR